jgi:hypothetical protein
VSAGVISTRWKISNQLADDASPADVALMLSAALETTRADINAAAHAREAGEERLISLSRTGVRLNVRHLAELRTAIEDMIETAREHPDADGVSTTVLWTAVDREDRAAGPGQPARKQSQPARKE